MGAVGTEQKKIGRTMLIVSFLAALFFLILTLFPLIQMVLISLKTSENFFRDPLGFPEKFQFVNYYNVWTEAGMGRLFFNTIVVTSLTIIMTMIVGSLAGFVLAKYRFRGRTFFYNYFMIGLIVPVQVLMVSLMKVSRILHMQNTLSLLIFLFTVFSLSLAIFLYTGFFKGIPSELIDAAVIDGASFYQILFHIALPLSTTINAIVAILVGMNPWKDFLIPLLFSSDEKTRTVSLGILQYQESFYTNWTHVFAMMVMQTIPIMILFILFQKYFVKGVIQGAVKS